MTCIVLYLQTKEPVADTDEVTVVNESSPLKEQPPSAGTAYMPTNCCIVCCPAAQNSSDRLCVTTVAAGFFVL